MAGRVDYWLVKIKNIIDNGRLQGEPVDDIFSEVTSSYLAHDLPVEDKVNLSSGILNILDRDERLELARLLIKEQVLSQRHKLNSWSTITAQSSQIDTGYIAQHLVSLQTQIAGQGMRGKGDDLSDGSEVKSANFLDSLDKKGAVAPRWNFTAVTEDIMERFLDYTSLYLLSMDLNTENRFRTRIWKIDVTKHDILRDRYLLWMKVKGYPKFSDPKRPSVNFQLFPPTSGTEETYARHGNGNKNGFPKIKIPLQDYPGAELIFRADETQIGDVDISVF